jgi:hypothetical protein
MPRARNLKPGFFSNEDLAECSFPARLCFAGLWTLADREGRLEDRPKRIKGELFRFDSIEVEPLLVELEAHGFLVRYEIDGDRFIQVSMFRKHQTPHYSEKPSVIKPPPLRLHVGKKFQESAVHEDTKTPKPVPEDSGSTPRVEPSLRGGRNPLNPESRILNPDTGEETTAAAPLVVDAEAPDDPQQPIPGTGPPKPKPYAVPDCPYAALLEAYHAELPMLPGVTVLNDPRREHMRTRWREVCAQERFDAAAGLEWFRWYFAHAAKSKHLTGHGRPNRETGRVWRATFDWLLMPTNFVKVIDGNYVDERAMQ